MLELRANPPDLRKTWLEVEFGLNEAALAEQMKCSSAGEIETLSGKKNRLSVGEPEVWNLVELLRAKGEAIPAEVELMLGEYDFYHIRFVCTFRPDKDCKFVWARFGLRFSKEGGKAPVAHEMFPKEVYEEVKISRNFKIGPNLKYQFVGIEGEQEFIRYEPRIISFGLLQSDPNWDFSESQARDSVRGDKELFMILKAPKKMKVEAEFTFGAEVQTFLGLLPMVPIRTYKDKSSVEGKYVIINPAQVK